MRSFFHVRRRPEYEIGTLTLFSWFAPKAQVERSLTYWVSNLPTVVGAVGYRPRGSPVSEPYDYESRDPGPTVRLWGEEWGRPVRVTPVSTPG